MDEVRRANDGELCGMVAERDGTWSALVVFGASIGTHASRDAAVRHVLDDGLAALAERWTLSDPATDEDEVVCIVEANRAAVTVARGYYSMPGVPTLRITADELAARRWVLRRGTEG